MGLTIGYAMNEPEWTDYEEPVRDPTESLRAVLTPETLRHHSAHGPNCRVWLDAAFCDCDFLGGRDAHADAWEQDILSRDRYKRANEYNIQTIEYLRKELKKQRKRDEKADLNPYEEY